MQGHDIRTMRVSNLVHEKAFRCLTDLQELEPETYNKLEASSLKPKAFSKFDNIKN